MSAALVINGVKLVAALGVTKVITDIIKTNTIQTNIVQKAAVQVGGFVLGSMIMDQTSKHVSDVIKAIGEKIEEAKQEEDNTLESSTETEAS